MADTKVTGLTAKTTAVDADLLYIIDSATSPFSSKKITFANLEARLRDATIITDLGAVTAAGGDYLLILDVSASPQALKKVLVSELLDNATHTGDAAGNSALTLQAAAISGKAEVTAVGTDYILILDTSASPHALKKALLSDVLDNATHSGDAAGSSVLTLQPTAISGKAEVTAIGTDYVLILDTSVSPHALKKALAADLSLIHI